MNGGGGYRKRGWREEPKRGGGWGGYEMGVRGGIGRRGIEVGE